MWWLHLATLSISFNLICEGREIRSLNTDSRNEESQVKYFEEYGGQWQGGSSAGLRSNLSGPVLMQYNASPKGSYDYEIGYGEDKGSVTFTAIIPKIPHLRLEHATLRADSDDATPVYILGTGAYDSPDPAVIESYAEIALLLPIAVREFSLYIGPVLTFRFIQENFCNFGVKFI